MKKLLSIISLSMLLVMLMNTVAFATPLNGGQDLLDYNYSTGGFLTDDTTDANDSDANDDVNWQELSNEYVILGDDVQFDTIYIDVTTAATGVNDGDLTFMYPNEITDDISMDSDVNSLWLSGTFVSSYGAALNSTGIKTFQFNVPGDWAQTTIDGGPEGYYIALNCGMSCASAMSSTLGIGQISVTGTPPTGGAVPEFSTYMFIAVLMFGAYLISRKPQVAGKAA